MERRWPIPSLAILTVAMLLSPSAFTQSQPQAIVIDATAPGKPFPHFWDQMFGSGRAILALRESYRSDLREVKKATDFQYVRFHAIFHDEVGVYDEDEKGSPLYNFAYVDQIYDGLLENGVRPFVEISCRLMALFFWRSPRVSPDKPGFDIMEFNGKKSSLCCADRVDAVPAALGTR